MNAKRMIPVITFLLLSLLAITFISPAVPVQASAGDQPAPEKTPAPWKATLVPVRETLAALPRPDDTYLENLLVREKLTLSNQQIRLDLSKTVAETTQSYIDSEKSAGKDTAALESALNEFTRSIEEARSANAAAAEILAAPSGFDTSGSVTDPKAARETIRSAGQSLRKAHLAITSGSLTLRQAVHAYRAK